MDYDVNRGKTKHKFPSREHEFLSPHPNLQSRLLTRDLLTSCCEPPCLIIHCDLSKENRIIRPRDGSRPSRALFTRHTICSETLQAKPRGFISEAKCFQYSCNEEITTSRRSTLGKNIDFLKIGFFVFCKEAKAKIRVSINP